MKKLYQWVINWAETPYGPLALFFLAFFESVIFPVPADILLIALALGSVRKSFRFALYCTIGSVSGAFIGYAIGHFAWIDSGGGFTGFANFFFNNIPGFSESLFNSIKAIYSQWGFWVIFTAGFTPVPYKIFTVTAGVFDINILLFLIASAISRGARFFIVALIIWKFGPGIRLFIEKYFNILALGLTAFLVGVFILVKQLL